MDARRQAHRVRLRRRATTARAYRRSRRRTPTARGERTHVAENTLLIGDGVINDTKEGGAGCAQLTPDDAALIADVSVPGATEIDRIDLSTGKPTTLVGGGREIQDCSLSRDAKTIAYTALDATHFAEIYVHDARAARASSRT